MTIRLYFLRHGVAYRRDEWQGDSDELRPLTDGGRAALKQSAAFLKAHRLRIDTLYTSPLVRARDTAKIVAKALNLEMIESDLLKPGFEAEGLQQLLESAQPSRRIMLVGHEPDFSHLIGQIIGGGAVDMRKGALACVQLVAPQSLYGQLLWLLPPDIMTS